VWPSPEDVDHVLKGETVMRWLRLLVLMWLLVRVDDNWDLVIIGGYDTEEKCRVEEERSLWGSRVFCAPAKTRTLLL
jgi:hypothetical protein